MTKKKYIGYLLCITICSACNRNPEIVQRPIIFDQQREQLSLQYIKQHYGTALDTPLIDPKMIVIHWTEYPTLERSYQAFYPSVLPNSRGDIANAGSLNVSAHFLIDREGTIYQLLPETTFARHVIGLNHCAIGIENVADGKEYPLTEDQFEANKQLVEYLAGKYDIEYLIGHDQYKSFIGHDLWKEKDPNYLTDKVDVGEEFINRLHRAIGNNNIKKAPGLN